MRLFPCLLLACTALLAATPAPSPGVVRVRLDTSAGPIVVAVDTRRAPHTATNFLAYVDDGRLDGTSFFRAARSKARAGGFVEGGIGNDVRRRLDPIPLEPTSRTGLHHVSGAVSMARFADPGSATGNFSILVGAYPTMDARPGSPGYAVFGRVVEGMATVARILAEPVGGGEGAMRGQMILRPVRIVTARRLDGAPHPTGRPKPWTLGL